MVGITRSRVIVIPRPSPTNPHLLPNSFPIFFRNVSWGLGVCSVFIRSVLPRRLVLAIRSFPSSPYAVLAFCSSSVSAFSFLLPFRVDPAPAGYVYEYKISIDNFFFFSFYKSRGHGSYFPSHANEAMESSRKGI